MDLGCFDLGYLITIEYVLVWYLYIILQNDQIKNESYLQGYTYKEEAKKFLNLTLEVDLIYNSFNLL